MKNLITIIFVLVTVASFGQNREYTKTLLTDYSLAGGDSVVYVTTGQDYKALIQVSISGATGTLDGKVRFYRKISGFTDYAYYTEDTAASVYDLDSTINVKAFRTLNTLGDTLKIWFDVNAMSGGTVNCKAKIFPNR